MVYLQGPSLINNWIYSLHPLGQTLANILGCCVRTTGAKGALCNATMVPESPETPIPVKRHKTEEESTIATQLSMCIKDNQELHKKLDAFDPSKIAEVMTQAVAGGYQKSFQKPSTHQKVNQPIRSITTKATGKSKYKSVWQTISWAA